MKWREIIKGTFIVLFVLLLIGALQTKVKDQIIQDYLELNYDYLYEEAYNEGYENAHSKYGDHVSCEYCSDSIPSEFVFLYNNENICPRCVYSDYRELVSDDVGKCKECNRFYYLSQSYGLGLCRDCGKSVVGDCTFCGKPTDIWDHKWLFGVCSDCLNDALEETDLQDFLIDFNETRD